MGNKILCVILALVIPLSFMGCGINKKNETPITVTLWHVYGAQTDSPLNDMIDTFNQTVGREKGIQVEVTSVSNNKNIHKAILASAFGDAGAAPLPDMFVAYPKTVLAMPDDNVLVDYRDYFSQKEISEFVDTFVDEGMVNDRMTVLPIAKSTEVMYINKTIFDRFATDTGAKIEDLDTWEGLFETSEKYAKWTDAKTPDIANDPKAMLVHDFHFNYFQVGVESLGEKFFKGDKIAFGSAFDTVYEPYSKAALSGGLWLMGGYATEPLRTADAIVSIASSASILYFSDVVTYPNNVSEEVEWYVRPCPVFENGEKLVMQRGAGLCTVKTTKEREEACITFLKWLTDEKNNVEFVTKAGYMPVKKAAFDDALPKAIKNLKSKKSAELYSSFIKTQDEYTFYTPPQIATYLETEDRFEDTVRNQMISARNKYLTSGGDMTSAATSAKQELMRIFGE